MKRLLDVSRFPRPEEGFRAVMNHAPQAEAIAASWIERIRPFGTAVYLLRRRIATFAVAILTGCLFVHVMFGANGMVVYKQKRAEYHSLRKQIALTQKDNDRYAEQVERLNTDQAAIEKEAREQFGYVKVGEYVYVPAPAKAAPSPTHTAQK
jgi:cell division protein FtsB